MSAGKAEAIDMRHHGIYGPLPSENSFQREQRDGAGDADGGNIHGELFRFFIKEEITDQQYIGRQEKVIGTEEGDHQHQFRDAGRSDVFQRIEHAEVELVFFFQHHLISYPNKNKQRKQQDARHY